MVGAGVDVVKARQEDGRWLVTEMVKRNQKVVQDTGVLMVGWMYVQVV
jgi:hypothetical protein